MHHLRPALSKGDLKTQPKPVRFGLFFCAGFFLGFNLITIDKDCGEMIYYKDKSQYQNPCPLQGAERERFMKIAISNDHAAVELKQEIMAYLQEKGHEVTNLGTDTQDSCHYPVYGEKVGRAVANGTVDYGICICGTGVGIGIAASRVQGVRVCTCSEPYTAKLSRMHNDTNVLAFGARVVGSEMAKMIVDNWLEHTYEGGKHKVRVDMLDQISG